MREGTFGVNISKLLDLTRERRTATAIPMMLAYGHQVSAEGDVYVTIADTALRSLATAGIHGTYLVDYLSFCE